MSRRLHDLLVDVNAASNFEEAVLIYFLLYGHHEHAPKPSKWRPISKPYLKALVYLFMWTRSTEMQAFIEDRLILANDHDLYYYFLQKGHYLSFAKIVTRVIGVHTFCYETVDTKFVLLIRESLLKAAAKSPSIRDHIVRYKF